VFAILALVLAAVGIYGVLAFSVAQRTHEIGIRMALGARNADVLRMVLRRTAALVSAGLAIGTAGALAVTRVLAKFLFEVRPTDPLTFVVVVLVLAAAALAAGWIPARRATRVDPMVALRYE
jgi:putative ABC transport system permease protein